MIDVTFLDLQENLLEQTVTNKQPDLFAFT